MYKQKQATLVSGSLISTCMPKPGVDGRKEPACLSHSCVLYLPGEKTHKTQHSMFICITKKLTNIIIRATGSYYYFIMQYGYHRLNIHALFPVFITVSDDYKQAINPGCSCWQKGTGCTCISGTRMLHLPHP